MAVRPNSLEFAVIFQRELDEAMSHSMLTGWMDKNAGKVKYNGGQEIKVPMLAVDGLGDYGRADGSGFVNGKATLTYETLKMTQDRGRSFSLDRHDVDETNYVATMGAILGTFQREQVVPEVDAYRLSKCISTAMGVSSDTNAVYSQTIDKSNVIAAFKTAEKTIRKTGYMGRIIFHVTYDVQEAYELAVEGKLSAETFKRGGVDIRVPLFNGNPIIATPDQYMVSAIELNDGKSGGQEAGGFKKGASAKVCNFVAIAENVPIAVTKQDMVRTFTPDENQFADSWKSDYRRYHDCFVMKNKENLIFANIKEAKA